MSGKHKTLFALFMTFAVPATSYCAVMRYNAAGECVEQCPFDKIQQLKTTHGGDVFLYAGKNTTPHLVVEHDGDRCYGDLVTGTGPGINIGMGDNTYHAASGMNCIPCVDDGKTFCFTPATTGNTYSFNISAKGEFAIDWGDGTFQTWTNPSASNKTISHTYKDAASNYQIKLQGTVTGYATPQESTSASAIRFDAEESKIKAMQGCLVCIFKTLSDGSQPMFYSTFLNNTELSGTIPENFFDGLYGQPVAHMFRRMFEGCGNLTGDIPAGFFRVQGTPTERLFGGTFNKSGITSIDAGIFDGISGAAQSYTFGTTFANTPITTIPAGIFNNITFGAQNTFTQTFMGTGITEIPADLFANITNDENSTDLFGETFKNTKITEIPETLFATISTGTNNMFRQTFMGTAITEIPETLFSHFSGSVDGGMFKETFKDCTSLTSTPDNMFAGFTKLGNNMFYGTFEGCTALTKIGDNMFGNVPINNWGYFMFVRTFYGCTALTGQSATIAPDGKKQFIYQLWATLNTDYTQDCYYGATGLSDYDCIPKAWGGESIQSTTKCTPE